MIVQCILNKGANISPLVLPYNINQEISEYNFIATIEESSGGVRFGYALTKSNSYTVYGVLIFKNHIRYLVQNDDNVPAFFSSKLFTILDNTISFDWEMKIYSIEKDNLIIIGYPDIVNYSAVRDMILKTPEAIRNFLNYKYYSDN